MDYSLEGYFKKSLKSAVWFFTQTDPEIGNLLPNNRRQRRICYALRHILYSVSAVLTSIFRMDLNSTSYKCDTVRSFRL